MAERVRIMHYEAESVRRILDDYGRRRFDASGSTRGDYQIEDLVNAIGEVYETALARRDARVNEQIIIAAADPDDDISTVSDSDRYGSLD